jgi:hypothetical protein
MAYADEGGAATRPPSESAKDRVLQFPKEKRRASLYARAGSELH